MFGLLTSVSTDCWVLHLLGISKSITQGDRAFLIRHSALQSHSTRLVRCFWNYRETRTPPQPQGIGIPAAIDPRCRLLIGQSKCCIIDEKISSGEVKGNGLGQEQINSSPRTEMKFVHHIMGNSKTLLQNRKY